MTRATFLKTAFGTALAFAAGLKSAPAHPVRRAAPCVFEGDTITIGSTAYTFRENPLAHRDVRIGDTFEQTVENLNQLMVRDGVGSVDLCPGTRIMRYTPLLMRSGR